MQDRGPENLSNNLIDSLDSNFEGADLRSIDANNHMSKCDDAAKLIKKNADLEEKLWQVRSEAKNAGTTDELHKD